MNKTTCDQHQRDHAVEDIIRIDGTTWNSGRLRSAFDSASMRTAAAGMVVLAAFDKFQTPVHDPWLETALAVAGIGGVALMGVMSWQIGRAKSMIFHQQDLFKAIHTTKTCHKMEHEGELMEVIAGMQRQAWYEMKDSVARVGLSLPFAVAATGWNGWNVSAVSLAPLLMSLPSVARHTSLYIRCKRLLDGSYHFCDAPEARRLSV